MSFKKKILAVAAVGALTVATAVPAMALENEFHGMYRFKFNMSNAYDASSGPFTVKDNPKTKEYLEQRARLMYIAKASDDLRLVTHFELDYSKFGDNSYAVGRNNGAALGADQINLETKNVYLDFNLPTAVPVNFKVGMQPWIDSYGGLIVNADMAGVLASAKYGGFSNSLGFFRFDDKGIAGKNARDFIALDTKYSLNKDVRIGASYYLVNDDTNATTTTTAQTATAASSIQDPTRLSKSSIFHTIGLNGEAKVGPATITGGVLYQFGNLENQFIYTPRAAGAVGPVITNTNSGHLSAFGGYVGSKVAVGPGTFNVVAAYTSGDSTPGTGNSNAFQSVGNTTSGSFSENTFYGANMHLLMRSKYEINSSRNLIYTSNNNNQGMTVGSLGYDTKFTDKLYGNANVGFGAISKTNSTNATADSKYLGTEINAEVGYKVYDNLSASVYGAYVALGDYFKNVGTTTSSTGVAPGKRPNDPFLATVMLNYVF